MRRIGRFASAYAVAASARKTPATGLDSGVRHGQRDRPTVPARRQGSRGEHSDSQAEPERDATDHQVGDRGDAEYGDRQGGLVEAPTDQRCERPRGDHTADDPNGSDTEHRTKRRQEQRVSRGVMPPVPLVVPLREADPPEQVNPVQLGRPIRAPPAQGQSNHTSAASEHAPEQRWPHRSPRHLRTTGSQGP